VQIHVIDEPFAGPVATALIDEVQQEYVVRYGGRDTAPVAAAEFAPPTGAFIVASVDGEPAGCVGLRAHDEAMAEIKRMYVRATYRRQGLGRALLTAAEERARALGYARVLLETGDQQPEAIALYTADGYRPLAGFGHYAGQPGSRGYAKDL